MREKRLLHVYIWWIWSILIDIVDCCVWWELLDAFWRIRCRCAVLLMVYCIRLKSSACNLLCFRSSLERTYRKWKFRRLSRLSFLIWMSIHKCILLQSTGLRPESSVICSWMIGDDPMLHALVCRAIRTVHVFNLSASGLMHRYITQSNHSLVCTLSIPKVAYILFITTLQSSYATKITIIPSLSVSSEQ